MNDLNVECQSPYEAQRLVDWLHANIKSVKAECFFNVVKIHKVESKSEAHLK